jgi:phosphoglycolate phosphatase
MRKKLIIFDLDGTLLNTLGDLTQAVNHALCECGISIQYSNETIRTFVGNGIGKLLERAVPEDIRTEEILAHMRAAFIPYYQKHSIELTCPYPGVVKTLKQLQERGILLAVASNKYQRATEKLVHHFFPTTPFVAIYGQREGIPVKPDPTIVNDILRDTGISRDETIYIGDSGVDMLTAQQAGVESIGVTWGFRDEDELRQHGAIHIVHNTEEIEKIIQG